MGICSFSAPQPIGVSFRFRKCKFRNISRNAIQHSAVDIGSGLPAPARDFHRARSPRLHASQWHPHVAKHSSDRSLTRRPCPQVTQCHPRVARLSGTGVKPVFGRCPGRSSARHPSPQVPLWHPGVAKQSSGRSLTQRPYPQVLQCQPRVARLSGTGAKPVSCR